MNSPSSTRSILKTSPRSGKEILRLKKVSISELFAPLVKGIEVKPEESGIKNVVIVEHLLAKQRHFSSILDIKTSSPRTHLFASHGTGQYTFFSTEKADSLVAFVEEHLVEPTGQYVDLFIVYGFLNFWLKVH